MTFEDSQIPFDPQFERQEWSKESNYEINIPGKKYYVYKDEELMEDLTKMYETKIIDVDHGNFD